MRLVALLYRAVLSMPATYRICPVAQLTAAAIRSPDRVLRSAWLRGLWRSVWLPVGAAVRSQSVANADRYATRVLWFAVPLQPHKYRLGGAVCTRISRWAL